MTDGERVLNSIVRADYLTDTLNILRAFVSEAIMHFGSHGIRVSAVDPTTAAMHDPVELTAEGFEHVPEGSFALGVNLEKFEDYLSKADSDDLVNLAFKPQKRMLNIQYGNIDADMACIDPDSIRDEPDTDDLGHPNQFTIPNGEFSDAVDVADLVSDHLTIDGRPDSGEVAVVADGDTDDVEVTFGRDDLLDPTKLSADAESMFSIQFMEEVAGVLPSGGEVEVRFGQEFPVEFEYEYADGHGHVQTMIAPRISTD